LEAIFVACKIYQIVYCVETQHSIEPWDEPWWQSWYLLQCPVVGIDSLAEARKRAREWKVQLGVKFQPVIIGETDQDFSGVDCDNLFGVTAIGGLDAGEFEFPDVLLEEKLEKR
jgi:hypothetical protein